MGRSQIITSRRRMRSGRYNDGPECLRRRMAAYNKTCVVDLSGKMENCISTRKFDNTPERTALFYDAIGKLFGAVHHTLGQIIKIEFVNCNRFRSGLQGENGSFLINWTRGILVWNFSIRLNISCAF